MTLKYIFNRLSFHILKYCITQTEFFSTGLYRSLYARLLERNGVVMKGRPLFIHRSVKFDSFSHIVLSEGCVISYGVSLLTHDYSRLIAYNYLKDKIKKDASKDIPAGVIKYLNSTEDNDLIDSPREGTIEIGKNSFIGANSFILPGTRIGHNCIIGATSVVRGYIPDGSIVIGNPAKIISTTEEMGIKWIQSYLNNNFGGNR